MHQTEVTIKGQTVSYLRSGQRSKLLFLHGGRVQARTFTRLIKQLSEEYEVIAPDIPGYGDSPTPNGVWSFADYATFFDEFLEQLHLTNVIVIGYSMGGGIALNLAAQSKRVSKLVLIDSSGLVSLNTKGGHHDFRRLWFYLTHPQYTSAFYTLLRDYLSFLWSHRTDYEELRRIRAHCRAASNDEVLQHITVPTSIIWGNQDWIFPIEIGREFQRRISGSKLHAVRGNHDWPIYDPLLLKQLMI